MQVTDHASRITNKLSSAFEPCLIGKYRDTLDHALLASAQIGALLQLAAPIKPPGITTLYLAVEDGEPLEPAVLRRGVDFSLAERAAGKRVLVACGAGISRSTTFVIAALKEAEGLSLLETGRQVRRIYPNGVPHMALWSSLCAYYGEPDDYMALICYREQGPRI